MIPKPGKNTPDEHKMYQMVIKYPKCPYIKYSKWLYNVSTLSHLRPSKIYPNWDFWFENKPSGNPVSKYDKVFRVFMSYIKIHYFSNTYKQFYTSFNHLKCFDLK
jgi:hypothetical protein